MIENKTSSLYYFALWFPILIATPLIVIIQNPEDFGNNILTQVILLISLCITMVLMTWLITKSLPEKIKSKIDRLIVSLCYTSD